MRSNLKAYKTTSSESSLIAADPHFITLKLFDGILESVSFAKGAIERKNIEQKALYLDKAIKIISALQNSLDKESEPEVSSHFDLLYSYAIERLLDSSDNLNAQGIDEVVTLLKPIRDAWANMPEASKQEGIAKINQRDEQRASL